MEFGFLLSDRRVVIDRIEIKPCHDMETVKEIFYRDSFVSNGWKYPPLEHLHVKSHEEAKFKAANPQISASYWQTPHTHSLSIDPYDDSKVRFLILGYGFLNGLYLAPVGSLMISRIPYQEGKLTGIILDGDDHEKGVKAVSNFYNNANPEQIKLAFAIIHWFTIGQTYQHEWERFDANYKVLDAIYKISGIGSCSHAWRPQKIAEHYGISVPQWAQYNSQNKSCEISNIRNAFVHEALYAGEPIGYKHPETNYDLELKIFIVKLIGKILGFSTNYYDLVESNPRGRFSWNFA